MSTSDKLNRILQSKSDIKDAIIEKGGVVQDSTPLKDYAQAIRDLQGGKPAIIGKYQPETKAKSKIIGNMQNHIRAKLQDTLNFTIAGSLNNNDGRFTGFRDSYNYITDVWNTNEQDVVMKFCINRKSGGYGAIYHCERVGNLYIGSTGILDTYCWNTGVVYTMSNPVPNDKDVYICFKFTNKGSTVLKEIFYNENDFSTDPSDLWASFEDRLYTNTSQNRIGQSSYNGYDSFSGEIVMSECSVESHSGELLKQYYILGRELYNE